MGAALVLGTVACVLTSCQSESRAIATIAPKRTGLYASEFDPPAAPGAMGPNVVAIEGGLLMSWVEPTEAGHRLRVAELSAEGWGAASTVVEADDLFVNWADFPQAMQARDGALYVSYLQRSGEGTYAYDVMISRRREGEGWQTLGRLNDDDLEAEHGFVSLLPEGEGVRAFWLDGREMASGTDDDDHGSDAHAGHGDSGGTAAMTLRTALIGDAVAPSTLVDGRTCDCCQTAAISSGAGWLVAYRDRSEEELRDIRLLRSVDEGWQPTEGPVADGWQIEGCPVNGPSLDSRGSDVVLAWYTGAEGGSVRVAFSHDGGRSFGAPIIVDEQAPLGRVDVVMREGEAFVSWLAGASDERSDIRLARVRDHHPPSRGLVIANIASARSSGFPRLSSHGDDLFVTWVDVDVEGGSQIRARTIKNRRVPFAQDLAELLFVRAGGRARRAAEISVGDMLAISGLGRLLGTGTAPPVDLLGLAAGRPLVMAFWASWCAPCRRELSMLGAIAQEHDDALFVAVGLESSSLEVQSAQLSGWGFEGQALIDMGLAATLGMPPLPGLLVLDADGRIRLLNRGALDSQALEAALERALEDEPPAPLGDE